MSDEKIETGAYPQADVAGLLVHAISLKEGNKELALFYMEGESQPWRVEIGNPRTCVMLGEVPSTCVMLGEVSGEVTARGTSATEALQNLITLLERR
jgi:hypothetical protein